MLLEAARCHVQWVFWPVSAAVTATRIVGDLEPPTGTKPDTGLLNKFGSVLTWACVGPGALPVARAQLAISAGDVHELRCVPGLGSQGFRVWGLRVQWLPLSMRLGVLHSPAGLTQPSRPCGR